MRRIISILLCSTVLATVHAQDETIAPFEGEIVYETYENICDWMVRMGNSIYFNGVHKVHLTVKGSKFHQYDETTGCHVVGDSDTQTFIHYCDHTKTGMDFSKNIEGQLMLLPRDITYNNFTAVLKSNTFSKTDSTKTILGHECNLYSGTMVRDMSMLQTYDIWAYVASDIPAPAAYNYHIWGMDVPNIALKWIFKYDGGHVGIMNVGELSSYIEADVIEINPKEVDDQEFVVPETYEIAPTKKSQNAFALMKYYKGVRQQLEKLGIKGGEQSEKTSGIHYKTDGEWDF